jgi:hypothetical protein
MAGIKLSVLEKAKRKAADFKKMLDEKRNGASERSAN